MWLPPVRLTGRRIVGAATLAAFVLALAAGVAWFLSPEQIRLRALSDAYKAKAEHHAELEAKFSRLSEYSDTSHGTTASGGQRVHFPIRQRPELIPKYVGLAKYHEAPRRKYENAAWHPWLPVEPDPPESE